jgi:hypothetical protein
MLPHVFAANVAANFVAANVAANFSPLMLPLIFRR